MYNQYYKNKIAFVIPALTLIFLCQHKALMHITFHLKTYSGGITADTTTDGIKHRQIGIHCNSESIPMGIVNVMTVIQHPSVMDIMTDILIYGINGRIKPGISRHSARTNTTTNTSSFTGTATGTFTCSQSQQQEQEEQ